MVLTHRANGMTKGSERVKRWRDNHRALHNLRRRQARKKGGDANCSENQTDIQTPVTAHTVSENTDTLRASKAAPTFNPNRAATIESLRTLINTSSGSPVPEVPEFKLAVFRDDCGRQITEGQWNTLQARKEKAAKSNYVIDEYSQ